MNKQNYLLFLFSILLFPNIGSSLSRSWYQKAQIGGDARHRSMGFSIGNKGYYGGGHINSGSSVTYEDYWEYDPATNSWTQIADYGGGLRYHSSAFTIDNVGYVGCGENGVHSYTNDFWKYIPEVNTWFPVADLPSTPRRGGVAFTISGKGYFGLGQSDDGYHVDFYSYDPETNSWTAVADFIGDPRSAAVSFAYNLKGYVGTGHKVGEALNDFYEYDPSTDSWTVKASVGGSIRQDAMAFSIDGKGYIGTGNDNLGNDFKDIWEYDFDTDTWTQIEDFEGQKRRYAVTFVIGNTPYLAAGTDGTNFKDFWAYERTVSVEENSVDNFLIQVFPNPSSDFITISTQYTINDLKGFSYSVIDATGKVCLKDDFTTNKVILEKEQFGTGLFFVNIEYKSAVFATKKIIFD